MVKHIEYEPELVASLIGVVSAVKFSGGLTADTTIYGDFVEAATGYLSFTHHTAHGNKPTLVSGGEYSKLELTG